MPASELIERVSALIAETEPVVPDTVRPELRRLGERLREPLRVAVVGRVKAGKSTLVNALLGQRVAPTDISECTRVVTWFRYGHPQRLVVQLKDGRALDTPLAPDGTLPPELPVPVENVASLHAYLANETLRSMTLIDTPGIGSVHEDYSASTEQLLSASADTARAAESADAIVFLLSQVMMADEFEALKLFGGGGEGEANTRSAANGVGVLSRADQLGDGSRDSWEIAVELAGKYATTFGNEMAAVVPVVGLIAETSEAAVITEPDVSQLARLAALDEKAFGRMLWSADRFTGADSPVSPQAREQLLELLALYGVERAVGFLREGTAGATALRRELSALSGIADVKRMLAAYFREQDHVLKVRSVLDALRRLSYTKVDGPDMGGLAKLRAEVEEARLDPVMHPIAELEVWHDICTGAIDLPPERIDELRRLFAPGGAARKLGAAGDDASTLRETARNAMVRWRTFMVTEANPTQARACRVALRSYQLLWEAAA